MSFFAIHLSLPAALGPGVYSASNRKKNKQTNKKRRFLSTIEHVISQQMNGSTEYVKK
jgi:hypothetical protein